MRWSMPATTGPRLGALALAVAASFGGSFSVEQGLHWSTALAQSEPVRPEVGRPLQAAAELIKQRKFKEALAKLHEVDAVPNRTAYENFLLEQMRGSAAAQADQPEVAIKSFQALIASGRLSEAEQGKYAGYIASLAYRGKDYKNAANWAARALKANPNDAAMRSLLIQSYFQAGDYAAATREAQADIEAAEKAGQKPAEEKLQLLANVAGRQGGDPSAYIAALEKLVAYYPKREYWSDLLSRIQTRPGFSQRLTLDVYRLRFATKTLTKPENFVEMTQLALQERQAGEAKKVIDEGFASGLLGKGPEAERQKRLQALAHQRYASAADDLKAAEAEADANGLVRIGLAYTGLGQSEKGIALIQQGIKKGGLRNPEDAQLHLGIAYLRAGDRTKAVQALNGVKGKDGAAELARLWPKVP
jgi:hypothetical protein